MNVTKKALVVGCVAGLMALPALAQQGPGTPEQRAERFEAMDANKDGSVDKAEFVAALPDQAKDFADQIWERIDADGDGSISKDQFMNLQMGR